jgi:flagellar biosynthesis/type III secretory pathway M-ring protein FliF/YscJ
MKIKNIIISFTLAILFVYISINLGAHYYQKAHFAKTHPVKHQIVSEVNEVLTKLFYKNNFFVKVDINKTNQETTKETVTKNPQKITANENTFIDLKAEQKSESIHQWTNLEVLSKKLPGLKTRAHAPSSYTKKTKQPHIKSGENTTHKNMKDIIYFKTEKSFSKGKSETIKNIKIHVLINSQSLKKSKYTASNVRNLLMLSLGLNKNRGDKVIVQNISFNKKSTFSNYIIMLIKENTVLFILILILLTGLSYLKRKRLKDDKKDVVQIAKKEEPEVNIEQELINLANDHPKIMAEMLGDLIDGKEIRGQSYE